MVFGCCYPATRLSLTERSLTDHRQLSPPRAHHASGSRATQVVEELIGNPGTRQAGAQSFRKSPTGSPSRWNTGAERPSSESKRARPPPTGLGSGAIEVRVLLGVIAYNLGNLLRWLVLPIAIQS